MSVYLSFCVSCVCVSVSMSADVFLSVSVHFSVSRSVCLWLTVSLSISPSVCLYTTVSCSLCLCRFACACHPV